MEKKMTADGRITISFKNAEGKIKQIDMPIKTLLEKVDYFIEELDATSCCTSSSCNNESQNFCDCEPEFENYKFEHIEFTPLPDNNGVKDGFEEWLIKEVDEKETDLAKSIDSGLPTQTDRIQLFALKDCLSAYRNFSPPAKVEVDLHSKGLSILNSIWTKVNERLKEKDYPELLLSGDEEEEILSNAFNLPAKVEVSESDIFEILSSIHPNAMYKDGKLSAWIDDDTKHIAVRKLCHLLSNK